MVLSPLSLSPTLPPRLSPPLPSLEVLWEVWILGNKAGRRGNIWGFECRVGFVYVWSADSGCGDAGGGQVICMVFFLIFYVAMHDK